MSRAAMTAAVGLSPAGISFVTADLIDEGLIVERAATDGAAGRRPVPLDINYGSRFSIGFKVMEERILGVITDLSTRALAEVDAPLPDGRPETVVSAVASAATELIAGAGVSARRIIGIGLALPGQVDAEHGICRHMQRSGWRDVPLARMLADLIDVPVWVDNDANAFAVAEHLFGRGRGHQNIAVIAIGRGVGAGLVVGGRLYAGASGAAGEFGHNPEVRGGRQCECGRRGCMETYCSDRGLVETWHQRDGSAVGRGPEQLAAASASGDAVARKVLRDGGRRLGRHIATLVNVVDPEIIIIGGESVRFGAYLFESMRSEMQRLCYGTPPEIAVNFADDGWQRGAAALAIQHFFDFEIKGGHVAERTRKISMSA